MPIDVALDLDRRARPIRIERGMKVRMGTNSERHGTSTDILECSVQAQAIADFVIEVEHKRKRPQPGEVSVSARIETRRDEVRTAPRDLECTIVGQAVNRTVMRRIVDGKLQCTTAVGKAAVGDSARPRKQDRYARAKRMRLPIFIGIFRPGYNVERADAIAAALKSPPGRDERAIRLRFDSDKFHRRMPREKDRTGLLTAEAIAQI